MPIDNSYEEMYHRFLEETADSSDISLPDDDPTVTKYRNLYSQPSRSEALLNAHNAQRPDYGKIKVSTLDEIGDAIGVLMTGDPKQLNATRDQKYQRAYAKWADEGKYIGEVREALDKDRARELSGAQFEIKNKIASERQKRALANKDQDQAARMARDAEANADRDLSRDNLKATREISQNLQRQGLDLRRESATRAAESNRLNQEAARDRAAKREIELKGQARAMTRAQFTRDPSFAKYFVQGPDGEAMINPELPMPELQKIRYLMEHMENLNYTKLQKGVLPR